MEDGSTEYKTPRTTLKRRPDRGSYDFESVRKVLDETFLCHVGITVDDTPFVLPTSFGRDGRDLLIHGSSASGLLRKISTSIPMCVTVTHFDGLVLARSIFAHSMNYRSAVMFGQATRLEGDEKYAALAKMSDYMIPGRWDESRLPTDQEMKGTSIVRFVIEEASVKVRSGPPLDEDEDLPFPAWAGVLPMTTAIGYPIDDPRAPEAREVPDYVTDWAGARRAFIARGGAD